MAITVSGTTITFNDATTQSTAALGSVTSVATGNGLSGGTITSTGTLIIACPTFNSVGSYAQILISTGSTDLTSGSNYSAGAGNLQFQSCQWAIGGCYYAQFVTVNNLSGTWKYMGSTGRGTGNDKSMAIACRVS